ncbi:MAG: glutamine-hydrolyzing carbamoyl-phosphate synthase small subunit [Alistipes sp.]|nr:glutamine-hydrolyzing carbamoyl-phosphate synthase small subunit [Alistipes sp.]MBR5585517.1 glutamine-hydrolyzing carbamoyl-phosphate synthase small subunit [Alistipes sp.]MBR6544297.1 glutamine-hydrolyzing carbamoyl-phosphate synthase small subunit [Alistipes sp.]
MKPFTKKLVLENGKEFPGYGFGSNRNAVCEIVFNTSMVGYQEIVSDPTYTDQIVVMTYPLMGNYGFADEDYESKFPSMGGMVVRECCDAPSNFRYTKTLNEAFEELNVPGISGVDTRMITRIIRNEGTQKAAIVDINMPHEEVMELIKNKPQSANLLEKVSCKKRWFSRTPNHRWDVVAIDCGIKYSFIRQLNAKGCNVTIVPYKSTAEEIMAFNPDGIFVSNGPGNPADSAVICETLQKLRGKLPIFGVDLGHQLIAISYGAKNTKMKVGHRGANHPVKCLENGKLEIVVQNHGYTIDEASLEGTPLTVTHRNLLDGTVAGIEDLADKVFSVQYQPDCSPEASSTYLFDKFIKLMEE